MKGNFKDCDNVHGAGPPDQRTIDLVTAQVKAAAKDDHDEQMLLTMIGFIPDPLARSREDVRREDHTRSAKANRRKAIKENS